MRDGKRRNWRIIVLIIVVLASLRALWDLPASILEAEQVLETDEPAAAGE